MGGADSFRPVPVCLSFNDRQYILQAIAIPNVETRSRVKHSCSSFDSRKLRTPPRTVFTHTQPASSGRKILLDWQAVLPVRHQWQGEACPDRKVALSVLSSLPRNAYIFPCSESLDSSQWTIRFQGTVCHSAAVGRNGSLRNFGIFGSNQGR